MLWNTSLSLTYLPDPLGSFAEHWHLTLASFSLTLPELLNILELVGMLLFFLYVTGRLSTLPPVRASLVPPQLSSPPRERW